MKINNSEILNKVKEKVSEKKEKLGNIKDSKILDSNDTWEKNPEGVWIKVEEEEECIA